MAVSENTRNFFTTIIPDGSTDWSSETSFPGGMRVWSILFYPSAANDIICIKEGSDSGPTIFKAKDVDGRGVLLNLPGNLISPYLDQSECTFGTAANVRITFYLA